MRPLAKPLGEADAHAVRRVLTRIAGDEDIPVDSKETMIKEGTSMLHSIEAIITKRLMKGRGGRGSGKSASRRTVHKAGVSAG